MDKIGTETLTTMQRANWYNNWLFSKFKNNIQGDILEVGAGVGSFTKLLIERGNVTVIEINKSYIDKLGKIYNDKVRIGYGDIEKNQYFFKGIQFDTIVCLNVLEHINRDKKAVTNMYKLLKKGGKLILLVPAHLYLFTLFDKKLGHFRRYNKESIAKILKGNGFSKVKIRYLNWWGAIGWFFVFKIFKKVKMPTREVGLFDKLGRFFLLPEKLLKPLFGLSVLAIGEK